ncbi:uncharacterized protein J8A68_002640 [[Candida] subhashii]|uniref:rRNA methyltransferase 2, mitochondrial n=1 Tax=[Candida] subhashii TaxID=561895 RepID=A0A8J5QNS7_9ASCO|nr:uncharacterized protein J8A68_002640 [[Candida] subhashii]KAG7663780.1 hypothetical protein J8A68_002640 [[Candida] subhashii]
MPRLLQPITSIRHKSSKSSTLWVSRHINDHHAKSAKQQSYRSRAAYKLIELNQKFKLFNKSSTNIVDLGFAPGAWTQVAIEEMKKVKKPYNIIGVDLIMCGAPEGSWFIQGDILKKSTHEKIREHFRTTKAIDPKDHTSPEAEPSMEPFSNSPKEDSIAAHQQQQSDPKEIPIYNPPKKPKSWPLTEPLANSPKVDTIASVVNPDSQINASPSADPSSKTNSGASDTYSGADTTTSQQNDPSDHTSPSANTKANRGTDLSRPVDLIISDMMANVTGIKDVDHFASMDLCDAALILSHNLLKPHGNLVMKFYTGAEDKVLESRMKKMFNKVARMKPETCRKESREMYIIGLKRKKTMIGLDELFSR